MTSPLPDGRVPMDVLLDEKDEEFLAEWDAADAEALAATQALLDRVGDRPLPQADLRRAAGRLRRDLARPGWPGRLLTECSGLRPKKLPADDTELWLSVAAGVASPQGPDDWDRPGSADGPGRAGRHGRDGQRDRRDLRDRPLRLAGGDHRARRGRSRHRRVGGRPGRVRAGLRPRGPRGPGRQPRTARAARTADGRPDDDEDEDELDDVAPGR